MRSLRLISSTIMLLWLNSGHVFAGEDTHAGQALKNSAQASGHASVSAAHSIAASGQLTSAAIAVPLSIGGAVLSSAGAVSTQAAQEAMKAATAPIGTPLEITDEAISTTPPNEALKKIKGIKKMDKDI